MTAVELDYPAAVQMIEAGEVRIALFEAHLLHGTARLDDVAFAVTETQRGIDAIRKAFRLPTEAEMDAACCGAEGSTPHWVHCPERPAPGEVMEAYGR